VEPDDSEIIFTDPVMHSRTAKRYGPSDLGPEGISSFFSSHKCSSMCERTWNTPADCNRYFKEEESTTMSNMTATPMPKHTPALGTLAEEDEYGSD
jgi:hypothetical protein